MRLLRVDNPEEPKLEEFLERNVPPYTILSHTWGDEEVSFQEMQHVKQTVKSKAGYSKILACCNETRKMSLEYCWVDTCCIDKSSSAELSEAINSMYHWYKDAQICFVTLGDVEYSSRDPSVIGSSRWFKRGWTLQELLAPSNVVFYTRTWARIGTKWELRVVISAASGIDQSALTGLQLKEFSVARRMFWASNRETTRREDRAYSLLGIFNVHMPLLYGEGNRAFVRLQEEIMKTSHDHSLFAWRSPLELDLPGLLAPHPICFKDAGNVVPTHYQDAAPCTVTSLGVRMELPLRKIDKISCIAALDCHEVVMGNGQPEHTRIWMSLCYDGTATRGITRCRREWRDLKPKFPFRLHRSQPPKRLTTIFVQKSTDMDIFPDRGLRMLYTEYYGCLVHLCLGKSDFNLVAEEPPDTWVAMKNDDSKFWISTASLPESEKQMGLPSRVMGALALGKGRTAQSLLVLRIWHRNIGGRPDFHLEAFTETKEGFDWRTPKGILLGSWSSQAQIPSPTSSTVDRKSSFAIQNVLGDQFRPTYVVTFLD